MNDERNLEELWQETIGAERISVEQGRLLGSVRRKAARLARSARLADLSDLWGGAAFALLVALILVKRPSIVTTAPLISLFGAALFAGAFILYHVNTYRARRVIVPDAPSLVQFLRGEKERVGRRISMLSTLVWVYALPALAGLYLVMLPAAEDATARIIVPAAFAVGATVLHLFIRRTLRKDYLPLRATIDDQLQALTAG